MKRGVLWFVGVSAKPDKTIPNSDVEVNVVIPAFNEEDNIEETIRSLQTQTVKPKRIIVVDDCSTDRTAEVARSCGVEVITTPKNTGTKARAQNYALKFLENEQSILVTVDADTSLDPRAIEQVLHYLQNSKVASACGFVVPKHIKTIWEKARFIQYLYYIWLNKGAQDHWGAPLVSSGCFSAFNLKLVKSFGGFPHQTMAEDMDLTWRFLMSGFKVRLVPEAICYPKDPHTYALYRSQVERWYRSFLQNISLHNWRLLRNKRLAFFIGWYLLSGLATPVFLALMIPLLLKSSAAAPILGSIALYFVSAEFLLVGAISLFKGWRLGKFWLALKSLPSYWIVGPVETYLFWKSVWLEWVLKRRLVSWEKGH